MHMMMFNFVFFMSFLLSLASAQTVTLTSSVEQDGRQAACPGEAITLTCTVTNGQFLQWIADSFFRQNDSVLFLTINMAGDVLDPTPQIHIVLIDIKETDDSRLRNYVSTLTFDASTALSGTVIQCSNAFRIVNKTLITKTSPSSPQNLTYTNPVYGLSNFTVAVQWERPASDGIGIDNYTLTGAGITAPLTVLSNEPLMTTFTLSYNEVHMVSITASNCAGESTASVVAILEVGCGPPLPPSNGSLGDLTSSQEGAVVTFQCNPGLVPSQEMMAVCTNISWSLDPAELVCRADCGDPSSPMNGFVMAYDSALEGSQIVFQCSPGFAPSQQMMSYCMADGNWTPNPAELECRADCGIPVILNGSVNYTTTVEGSTATYQCGAGLIPIGITTAVCMRNGKWDPDPVRMGCRLPGQATCGVPPSPGNGCVDFTNVIEGSEATFRCDSGPVMTVICTASGQWVPNPGNLSCNAVIKYLLISVGVTTALCMGNGKWDPDPIRIGCKLPALATCGAPPNPSNRFVDFTNVIEESEATFRCDSDPEMTAICMASGKWVPNPGNMDCVSGLSTAETVGISVTISSIVSFTAGLLVALLIARCYIRRQKTNQYSPSEPAPMYEDVSMDARRDIELKENVAYRVVGQ